MLIRVRRLGEVCCDVLCPRHAGIGCEPKAVSPGIGEAVAEEDRRRDRRGRSDGSAATGAPPTQTADATTAATDIAAVPNRLKPIYFP